MALRLSLVLCNKYPSTNNTHIRVELLLSSDQDSSTALCAYHHTGGSIVCVYVPSLGTPFCEHLVEVDVQSAVLLVRLLEVVLLGACEHTV